MTKAKWKRWINAGCGCLAMAGATGLEAASAAGTQKHPNIVFIISDDSGWGDVGWNGNPVLDTPVLDALHKQSWPVEVSEGGNYEVLVLYTAKQLGTITVQVGENSIEAAIPEAYDPPYEPSHNRAPVVTLPEKPFRSLLIGTINIPSGSGEVRATTTEGAEIQTVRLKRRQP